jgi:hypothetical protein
MKNNIKNIVLIIAVIAFFIMLKMYLSEKQGRIEQGNLIEASAAELQTWKNKNGEQSAKIQVLETEKTKDFLSLRTKDILIKELQKEVKRMEKFIKKQGSVTVVEAETVYDTIYKNNEDTTYSSIFGTFISSSINNQWIVANFGVKLDSLPDNRFVVDSTIFNLKVVNKYVLTVGREKTGFLNLGKSVPFVEVKNLNPYTSTTALRSYQVTLPPPKRFGIGPVAAYGLTENGFGVFVGVGVTYTVFRL